MKHQRTLKKGALRMTRSEESRIREDYHRLTKLLIERKLTITTMESATSGQIASLLTDTEGASAILRGAFITYSNEAKIKQGVPAEIIRRYSVYSKETAEAMANACRKAYSADIGIGITGTMGNIDPENAEASVPGRVFFAISFSSETAAFEITIPPQDDRLSCKLAAAKAVARKLFELLESRSF